MEGTLAGVLSESWGLSETPATYETPYAGSVLFGRGSSWIVLNRRACCVKHPKNGYVRNSRHRRLTPEYESGWEYDRKKTASQRRGPQKERSSHGDAGGQGTERRKPTKGAPRRREAEPRGRLEAPTEGHPEGDSENETAGREAIRKRNSKGPPEGGGLIKVKPAGWCIGQPPFRGRFPVCTEGCDLSLGPNPRPTSSDPGQKNTPEWDQ